MDKALRDFIEEQRRKNISPPAIRAKLLSAGWPQKIVDEAMRESFRQTGEPGKKNDPRLMLFALIVIIALGAVILVVTLKPILPGGGTTNNTPHVPIIPGGNTGNSCQAIDSSTQKDACYQALVASGFDCGQLTNDVEKAFCFRALDYYLTTS